MSIPSNLNDIPAYRELNSALDKAKSEMIKGGRTYYLVMVGDTIDASTDVTHRVSTQALKKIGEKIEQELKTKGKNIDAGIKRVSGLIDEAIIYQSNILKSPVTSPKMARHEIYPEKIKPQSLSRMPTIEENVEYDDLELSNSPRKMVQAPASIIKNLSYIKLMQKMNDQNLNKLSDMFSDLGRLKINSPEYKILETTIIEFIIDSSITNIEKIKKIKTDNNFSKSIKFNERLEKLIYSQENLNKIQNEVENYILSNDPKTKSLNKKVDRFIKLAVKKTSERYIENLQNSIIMLNKALKEGSITIDDKKGDESLDDAIYFFVTILTRLMDKDLAQLRTKSYFTKELYTIIDELYIDLSAEIIEKENFRKNILDH